MDMAIEGRKSSDEGETETKVTPELNKSNTEIYEAALRGLGQIVQRHEVELNKGKSHEEEHSNHENGLENSDTHNGNHYGGGHNTTIETTGSNSQECEEYDGDSIAKAWKDVHKFNPQTFDGKFNPIVSEAWIDRLETIFYIVKCNEQQKVTIAAVLLVDDAKMWWKNIKLVDGTNLNWQEFKAMLYQHYFPTALQLLKETEFYALQ
ncbi:hypothetical protein K1719_012089 [Acacia pycnantha]|nr:hypothetical protein K1719_012089 [Acacia pycnantha]